jgi:hypothetical protein
MDSRVQGTQFCDREGSRSWSSSSSTQTGSHTNQIILGWEPNACAIQYTQQHVICTVTTDSRDEHPKAPKSTNCSTRLVLLLAIAVYVSELLVPVTVAIYLLALLVLGTDSPLKQGIELRNSFCCHGTDTTCYRLTVSLRINLHQRHSTVF